jgi:acylphosphatase
MIVTGRVQGVFFRDSTRQAALALGLSGMVRNLPDGSVEIVAEGGQKELDDLVLWAHQGPTAATVTEVAVTWEEPQGAFASFTVEYS